MLSAITIGRASLRNEDPTITEYNRYEPDGNSTILVAIDSHLLGDEQYFPDEEAVKTQFEGWLTPFETKFGVSFHVKDITTFTPAEDDSLDDSFVKVPNELGWQFSTSIGDPNENGNGYDFLIIYQENYRGGQNRANAIHGNALIIAHYQPIQPNPWTSRQLILLHEVGHLFGGGHDANGDVDPAWYGNQTLSFMDYKNLSTMYDDGWDKNNLPCDDENFAKINSSRFRFDLNDADADNMPNYYENRYGLNPNANDSLEDKDNDGLGNLDEYLHGTNAISEDTDQDSFSDWAEVYLGTSPINASELPSVPIPIIVSDTKNTTIIRNNLAILRWRAISSDPTSYRIYQNGSNVFESPWQQELIQYQVVLETVGLFNFTVVVRDQDGDETSSTILLRVNPARSTNLSWVAPILAIYLLVKISQRKQRKNEK